MTTRKLLNRNGVVYATRGIHPIHRNVGVWIFYKDETKDITNIKLDMYESTDKGMNDLINTLEESPHNIDMSKVNYIKVCEGVLKLIEVIYIY